MCVEERIDLACRTAEALLILVRDDPCDTMHCVLDEIQCDAIETLVAFARAMQKEARNGLR